MQDAAALQASFLEMLDGKFRRFGLADGLPPRLRAAVEATPRHRFVHRFRVDQGPLCDSDADPAKHLSVIYSDAVMRHVDAAGETLPSSNSEPSYVLRLLQMLDIEPGQTILEIGSGSGWLAAVMAHLVGPEGRVTGIELIPDLAAQSRADLARASVGNVTVITGDGTQPHPAPGPYDRAIITAATWDLPPPLFDQVAEAGLVLAPIELRSPDGCAVTLLRRQGAAFIEERAVPGWFVPLRGGGQDRDVAIPLPTEAPSARCALPLAFLGASLPSPVAAQFRAFLGRTEPGFVSAHIGRPEMARFAGVAPFGLRTERGLALWQDGEILTHGAPDAATNLARAFADWAALGLPGLAAFRLAIVPADAAPPPSDRLWIEPRGRSTLAWQLRPEIGDWAALLDTPPPH